MSTFKKFHLATVCILGLLSVSSASAQAPVSLCKLNKLLSLPLQYFGPDLALTLEGSINGKPVRAHVYSEEISGFSEGALGIPGVTAVGDTHVRIGSFTIGPHKASGYLPLLNTQHEVPLVVGGDYLYRTDVELALKEKQISFFKSEGCKGAHLAYWSEDALSIPFETKSAKDLIPRFTVQINGKPVTATIATQFMATTLDIDAAKRLGITPDTVNAEKSGVLVKGIHETPIWSAHLDSFQIGDEKVSNNKIWLTKMDEDEIPLKLGLDFLRAHRVLISMSQKRLYFSHVGGGVFSGLRSDGQPWYATEAEDGNADAQIAMAKHVRKLSGAADSAAVDWYRKAASTGHRGAIRALAEVHFERGEFAESIPYYRQWFSQAKPSPYAALRLYLALARSGDRQLAQADLAALRPKIANLNSWEKSLFDYHLDKATRAQVMKEASEVGGEVVSRMCDANFQSAQYEMVMGRQGAARPFFEAAREKCAEKDLAYRLSNAELARMPKP